MSSRTVLRGASGNSLAMSECVAVASDRPPVLLVHGGGQTRHAWRNTASHLARLGYPVFSLDQRGHGESDWVKDGAYAFDDFAADLVCVASALRDRCHTRPVVVGASLGGIASLLAHGMSGHTLFAALVLVDITPRMNADGVQRVQGFMGARMREGFASLQEAADSIAEYLPNRRKPRSLAGLEKNLRRDDCDGRYRWHWDPAFIDGPRSINTDRMTLPDRLDRICADLQIPTLLVRGARSELVSEEAVAHFCKLVPHSAYADVSGAGHMVAGDSNDAFTQAVAEFLNDRLAVSDTANR